MTLRKLVLQRYGEYIRVGYRPARLTDWIPVAWFFLRICWRPIERGYLDARTAWAVAEIVNDIERRKKGGCE